MLEKELDYFKRVQDELRAKNPQGGFAVIKDETLLGIWQNRQDALKEAVKAWGNNVFLVKNINESLETSINYSRKMKLINAVPNQ